MNLDSRRIDTLIAIHVFGKKVAPAIGVDFVFDEPPPWVVVPKYSSDVAAAWTVVEALADHDPQILQLGEGSTVGTTDLPALGLWTWWVDFEGTNSGLDRNVRHRDISMAICLAALRLKGVSRE